VKPRFLASVVLLLSVAIGCGPPPEEAAIMTASAWTPTPPPPPTATPLPYDLTLHVTDEGGAPLAGARIVFSESGSNQPVQTDAAGAHTWTNLPSATGNLDVSAPGYFHARQAVALERGPSEMVLVLRRDPFALLPEDACAPDEKLLYLEDFQDGKAEGWPQITDAVELAAQNGWAIQDKDEGNKVLAFSGIHEGQDNLQGYTFENLAWRVRVQTEGADGFSFLNLKHAQTEGSETRYPIQWGASPFLALTRLEQPGPGHVPVKISGLRMKQGRWYYLEISAYQGLIQIWVDGKKLIEYRDPKPLPLGMIGLEGHIFKDPKTAYYFDNLSVCELTAPFATSIYNPAQ
jgi:hypothetical protein